ncbi:hypothetical protein [Streptomyces solaniscabiei]|uniref:hypothetical protein n=1 Tax=Streptomyces solaniscabiei TaxID=2683255 RepID=UPI001CE2780C|nr:hypothetical protein [Streptomyces solaniscabiei]
MPHPLGRMVERPDEQGRVWVTTPHIRQLQRLVREGHLAAAPAIHDSWTGKANESLTNPFYEATRTARTELLQAGGDPYKAYRTRLSIALPLLWPKRQEQKSPFWRPDWRMSMVAEASSVTGAWPSGPSRNESQPIDARTPSASSSGIK